jgi:hypothetical protein
VATAGGSALRSIAVMVAPVLSLIFFGCTRRQFVFVSTAMPMASYAKIPVNGSSGKIVPFFFPQLNIYDASGNLIYSGNEALDNAQILRELPEGISALKPEPGAPSLVQLLNAVPDFRAREKEILAPHRITVFSISLDGCHACMVQEDAVSDTKDRLLDKGVNLLVIHVSRPGS